MFIGRKEELKTLSKAIKQTDNATLIYGKRRIGKTTLIKEVLNKTKTSSVYYDDSKNHKNGEFDVAIEYDDGYGIVEVKYYQKPMKSDDIRREIRQIKEIREIQIKTIGFVSINGFDKKESGSEYYTGEDVYCDNREKKKVVKQNRPC